ncbi:hypothetical protein AUP41_00545 [Thalassospira xiamenensis]|nr:hypothetical protein AUP41_00545 [Thalassospira xiamenensis]
MIHCAYPFFVYPGSLHSFGVYARDCGQAHVFHHAKSSLLLSGIDHAYLQNMKGWILSDL